MIKILQNANSLTFYALEACTYPQKYQSSQPYQHHIDPASKATRTNYQCLPTCPGTPPGY